MPKADDPSTLSVASDPGTPAGIEAWRALVERSFDGRTFDTLRSQTRDGITIEPLYARSPDAPRVRGRGADRWIVVQPIDEADPDKANERAIAGIGGGATGLALRFSSASSDGAQGLPPTPDTIEATLDGIDVATLQLRLEPHEEGIRIARWVEELIARSGLAPESADVAFGLDPLAAVRARVAPDPRSLAETFLALKQAGFRGSLALLDGRSLHESGGTEAQELAAILGSAAWWLRTLEASEVAPDAAFPFLAAALGTDCDMLVSIAKIRALRLLWARLEELCGATKTPLRVHAETSRRMLTRTELTDNLLRNTLAAFAAGVGGADSISVLPHIAAIGISDRNARALARNIQHLLMDECDLHRVFDPAAGSGAIEALTEALAERGWEEFRVIEREGGIVESLGSGGFQDRIALAAKALGRGTTGAET